ECVAGEVKAPWIQDWSTNGNRVSTRSLNTTDPSAWAAFHCRTNSAVSLRDIEWSERGLTSMASSVGLCGFMTGFFPWLQFECKFRFECWLQIGTNERNVIYGHDDPFHKTEHACHQRTCE